MLTIGLTPIPIDSKLSDKMVVREEELEKVLDVESIESIDKKGMVLNETSSMSIKKDDNY